MNEPKIRFKGFSGEWEEHSLAEKDFSIIAGGDIDRTIIQKSGRYPVIANAITSDGILGYYEKSYRVKGPAVTVTGRGDVGMAFARHYSFTPVVRLLAIKSTHNVDFLANAINLCQVPIESTGVPQLTTYKLQEYNLFMPYTIDEENKLASFFTTLDSLIQSTTKKIESLKQVKAASLQSMFPQEGETKPRVRFKGFEGEWEKVAIKKIATFSKGRGYSKSDLRVAGSPIILYGRMYTKYEACIKQVDTYVNPKPNSIYSLGNEVIMPASGETPEDISCASAVQARGIILGGDLNVLRFNIDYYDTTFVALSMSIGQIKKDLSNMAQGKSVVHLHNSDIEKVDMFIPSFAEQQKIASYFTSLDSQITLQTQRLEKLKQIKSACLDNMFV